MIPALDCLDITHGGNDLDAFFVFFREKMNGVDCDNIIRIFLNKRVVMKRNIQMDVIILGGTLVFCEI